MCGIFNGSRDGWLMENIPELWTGQIIENNIKIILKVLQISATNLFDQF